MTIIAAAAEDMTGTYLNYLWLSLVVIAAFAGLIWLGWRNRKRRQSALPPPSDVPSRLLEAEPEAAAEGMVIGTVHASNHLDRIAVHQLGVRTDGRIEAHTADQEPGSNDDDAPAPGLVIFRAGSRNWFIPAPQISSVSTESGMVGKFVERDGVIMIGWRLGQTAVATGFRPRSAAEGRTLLDTLRRLVPDETPPEQPRSAHSPNL